MSFRIFKYRNFAISMFIHLLFNGAVDGQTYFKKTYLIPGGKGLPGKLCQAYNGDMAMIVNTDAVYGGFLIKTDPSGHLQFVKNYRLQLYPHSELNDLMYLSDTTFLIMGDFQYSGGSDYKILLKTNFSGDIIWSKSFGTNSSVRGDYLAKRTNESCYIIQDNSTGSGIIISSMDFSGNFMNSIRLSDSNSILNISKVKAIENNEIVIVGKKVQNQNPLVMVLDTLYNIVYSMEYPGYSDITDIFQTYDSGFLCLMQNINIGSPTSFSIMKTDSNGIPIWTKILSDSTKVLISKTIFENDDHSMYCITNWTSPGSFDYKAAIIHLDSTGNIINISDSLLIHRFTSLTKTTDNKFCSVYADGWSNSYKSTILITDSIFSSSTISCNSLKPSTISQSGASGVALASPKQISVYTFSTTPINLYDSIFASPSTITCLPGGIICLPTFSSLSITSCNSYISPSGNYLWTQSGTYTDTIYNVLGCDSIITINLTILPLPIVTIAAIGALSFCEGDSVILSATPGMSYYQWYRRNAVISGANSMDYIAKTQGRYKCIAQSAVMCSDTSNEIMVSVPCISLGPNHERLDSNLGITKQAINIHPNPGTGIFYMVSPIGHLQILNSIGALILSTELYEEKTILDISLFSDGIYFCSVRTSDNIIYHKVVISR